MKNWIELINENKEKIFEVGLVAFKEALENTHMEMIVEMNSNGDVYSWSDVAGGNSFHVSNNPEIKIEPLMSFCNQGFYIMEEVKDFDNKEDAIEWYCDEYAYEEVERKLQYAIEDLKRRNDDER